METDTTSPRYWLNWRFLFCVVYISLAIVVSLFLIWKYEGRRKESKKLDGNKSEDGVGCVYQDEIWKTCLESVHPIWLLAFRVFAFAALFAILLAEGIIWGVGIFFFYTQWTFTLVTFYFALASALSIHGCLCHRHERPARDKYIGTDSKEAKLGSPSENSNTSNEAKCRTTASFWGYALQVIFQICAGAVALTDLVFWIVLYPVLRASDYPIDFLVVSMHSVNAVFLVGDIILSRLRFPFFRMAYFILYTCSFVVFQWLLHASQDMSRWPYPFLDLTSPIAPLWYFGAGVALFPCFALYLLIFWLKRCYAST